MSQPNEDLTRFLVDDDAEVVTIDLTTGLTADQARRRQLEREIRHTIKTLVHDTRTSSALSQVAAAKCWGAEQSQVSRLERDPGNSHVATLLSYLNALGAHVEFVYAAVTTDPKRWSSSDSGHIRRQSRSPPDPNRSRAPSTGWRE